MTRMLERAVSVRDRVVLYQRSFGRLRGIGVAVAGRLPRSTRRRFRAQGGGAGPILLRAGTEDVELYSQIMLDQQYECTLSRDPNVIVDAGAHVGLASIWFANRYPRALIVAIEPEAANFELLVANTAAYPNVHALQAALWVRDGELELQDPGCGTVGFRVSEGAPSDNRRVVRGVSLAGLMEQFSLDHVDLLKVDIEGAEVELFSECSSWIERVDGIVVELHDRFRPGGARAFFGAVGDFPIEQWKGENVFVARACARE
jgi:FkbM family methyltransferase